MAADAGLKMQFVLSFHQCGGNVGDTCDIPLPSWVLNSSDDIFFQDQHGNVDKEVVSLFADSDDVVGSAKRSPLKIYKDFMTAFKSALSSHVGSTISEIQVGAGPCGELRYPSYQMDKWSFCGVGEFQSYSSYAMGSLTSAANTAGHPEWAATGGPTNAGSYNSVPADTGFFGSDSAENYRSPYGQFYLDWYSSSLVTHGQNMLTQANAVFGSSTKLAVKVAGIHWWYLDDSHAAELTAGYYNINGQNDIYQNLASMFTANNATFDFTCLEMQDSEQPSECKCGPFELVQQAKQATKNSKGHFSGENALQRYDTTAYGTIKSQATSLDWNIDAMTYLRLTEDLMSGSNWDNFNNFVNDMNYL
jgi:beta-amylase